MSEDQRKPFTIQQRTENRFSALSDGDDDESDTEVMPKSKPRTGSE